MGAIVSPPNTELTQPPTLDRLNQYLDLPIGKICDCDYANDSDNHCAHFVSHVMGFRFGATCKGMTGKGGLGASIRVHELFAKCPTVGNWGDLPSTLNSGLAFVTDAKNVNLGSKTMENVPKKHVGIFLGGTIWHYSNTHHKVVTEAPGAFSHHYPGKTIAVFYGSFPL